MEEAAASLGAGPLTVFRRIVLPALLPAILSGVALGLRARRRRVRLARADHRQPAVQTEVASVYIFGQIEDENLPAAAAVSVVLLLAVSLHRAGLARRWYPALATGREHVL